MDTYKNPKQKEQELINYLKQNPTATCKQIKKDTKIKIERIYLKGGIKEAYQKSNLPLPDRLKRRTKIQRIEEVIKFIKDNPTATVTQIKKELGIDIPKTFKTIKEAYAAAKVIYPRVLSKKIDKKLLEKVLSYIRKHPFSSSLDIKDRFGIYIYKHFKNMNELYKKAGIKSISGSKKRTIKKQKLIIQYIKKNNNSTQWEINKNCKTHIQDLFRGGIIEAYKLANVQYPINRRKRYGAADKDINKRALNFENEIILLLKKFGDVNRHFKNKGGIADALLKRGDNYYIIEIKDYQSKPISLSDIKQLNKYIESTSFCNKGVIICNQRGKKNKVYIGSNEISILTKEDLMRDCSIIR